MNSPRNAAVVAVPETDVLSAFAASLSSRQPFCIRIPQGIALPANCTLLGVHHDYLSRVFYFAVAHPSFAAVAEGDRLPVLSPSYAVDTPALIEVVESVADEFNATVVDTAS